MRGKIRFFLSLLLVLAALFVFLSSENNAPVVSVCPSLQLIRLCMGEEDAGFFVAAFGFACYGFALFAVLSGENNAPVVGVCPSSD